jgi:hypothetical protein
MDIKVSNKHPSIRISSTKRSNTLAKVLINHFDIERRREGEKIETSKHNCLFDHY